MGPDSFLRLVFVLLLGCAAASAQADLRVPGDYATIGAALTAIENRATSDRVVRVAPGNWTQSVTLSAALPAGVVLRGEETAHLLRGGVIVDGAVDARISNFTLTGSGTGAGTGTGPAVRVNSGSAISWQRVPSRRRSDRHRSSAAGVTVRNNSLTAAASPSMPPERDPGGEQRLRRQYRRPRQCRLRFHRVAQCLLPGRQHRHAECRRRSAVRRQSRRRFPPAHGFAADRCRQRQRYAGRYDSRYRRLWRRSCGGRAVPGAGSAGDRRRQRRPRKQRRARLVVEPLVSARRLPPALWQRREWRLQRHGCRPGRFPARCRHRYPFHAERPERRAGRRSLRAGAVPRPRRAIGRWR